MGKTLLAVLLVIGIGLGAGSAGAQDRKVSEEELRSGDYAGIVFENYSGAYDAVESAEAIQAIGLLLAADLERSGEEGRYALKYSVTRAVDPSRPQGLEADIFSIDRDARVDHIDNIRRIVATYLESAWDYPAADARLLASFVTLYNAVYRGDLDYFGGRYKPVVLSHLTRADAGLSTRYAEWPGATRMLIPLAAAARKGPAGALGTDELTAPGVVEQLRSQPDRGLESRKEMVELKEREVAAQKAQLQAEKKELETRQEALAREERAVAEEQTALAERKTQASTPAQKEEAARQEESLARRGQELQAQKAEAAREETAVAAREAALAGREKKIEAERQGIVQDERALPFQPTTAAKTEEGPAYYSDKLYYLWAREPGPDGTVLRGLSVLDPFTAGVHRTSPVARITSPAYHFFQNGILVIAYPPAGGPAPSAVPAGADATGGVPSAELPGAVRGAVARLVLLHPASLEPVRWSEPEVHPLGMIFLQGESLYTVVRLDGAWRLGRFDGRLALAAASSEAVRPDGFLAAFGRRVYATDLQGRVLALDGQSLARQARIERP